MRVRIARPDDLARLIRFLVVNDYPYDWYAEHLSQCLILKLEHGDEVAGYLWMHWLEKHPDYVFAHVAVAPAYHGRWMLRSVVSDIFKAAELIGAHAMFAMPHNTSYSRALRRIGFEPFEDGLIKRFEV